MKTVDITYRYETRDTPARSGPLDSDAALLRLDDGNRAFAAILEGLTGGSSLVQRVVPVDARDLGLLPGTAEAPEQRPFAAVLGCSDARVPVELIFSEGPNDLFVIRVAGNGLGTEVLGSLKYAVDYLGKSLKLVVVLGHSGCGALTAAVDVFLNPSHYLSIVAKHSLQISLMACSSLCWPPRTMLRAFGPNVESYGISTDSDRGIDHHKCCACCSYNPARTWDERSNWITSGIWHLSSGNPGGLGATSWRNQRNGIGCAAARSRGIYRAR